jgi:hypothetical protein
MLINKILFKLSYNSNRDLMNLLKNVSSRLENVEKKLGTMEAIEEKIRAIREGH